MRSRKTIEVCVIKEWANQELSRTDKFATFKYKAGVCTILEKVLHECGKYRGFYFVNPDVKANDEDYYARWYY